MLRFVSRLCLGSWRPGRRVLRVGVCILVFALVLVGAERARAARTLTILHTSEHHGTALPLERRGEKRVAGMAGRATLIASVRREAKAVLLVDSGDILIGSALSSFFRGEPDILAMNLMGYQAMAAGNHDFDFGLAHLGRLQELAQFPILCSNVVGRETELPCQTSAVVRIGDFIIGLIGLLGHRNFPDTFNREVVKVLKLRDPIETARALARSLKATQGVDLVIALTHQVTEEDLMLLARAPEVDAIVGGHTHGFDGLRTARLAEPVARLADPGPVFVKTHRQGRTLGRLDLQVAKKTGTAGRPTVVHAEAWNLPVTEELEPNPAVKGLIERYSRKLERETTTVIGRSTMTLDGESSRVRSRETRLGNLLADLLRAKFNTNIALVNSGMIRDSIPPGLVDFKRVLRVLPFDSPTVTFTITGQQLLLALENSASRLPQTSGRFLQVSGLSVLYDLSAPPGSRVGKVTVGGQPLEAAHRYSVGTDAFLADGGDGYTMFAAAEDRINRQIPMRDLLLEGLHTRPLEASLQGRIRFVGGAARYGDQQPSPDPTAVF